MQQLNHPHQACIEIESTIKIGPKTRTPIINNHHTSNENTPLGTNLSHLSPLTHLSSLISHLSPPHLSLTHPFLFLFLLFLFFLSLSLFFCWSAQGQGGLGLWAQAKHGWAQGLGLWAQRASWGQGLARPKAGQGLGFAKQGWAQACRAEAKAKGLLGFGLGPKLGPRAWALGLGQGWAQKLGLWARAKLGPGLGPKPRAWALGRILTSLLGALVFSERSGTKNLK